MSPSIFETKWLEKFKSLAYQDLQFPRTRPESDWCLDIPFQFLFVRMTRITVQHIHFCTREARTLGIKLPEPEIVAENPRAMATALCAMLAHHADIEDLIEAWKKLKNGKRLSNTYRWRDYPLQLRRDLNSLIEEVRREKESGYWVVDGKARALCAIMLGKRGQEAVAGQNSSRGHEKGLETAADPEISQEMGEASKAKTGPLQ